MAHSTSSLLDRSAIGLSGLCLVHCLALPITALAIPSLAAAAHAEWVHLVLVLVAAPLSAMALFRSGGWRSGWILIAATTGLGLLTAGALAQAAADETILTVVGGICLTVAHLINLRRERHVHPAVEAPRAS
jgi:hypothetical protein